MDEKIALNKAFNKLREIAPRFLIKNPSSFLGKVSVIFVAQILSRLLAIATTVIIARSLGPDGKGILTLVALIPSLLMLASNLGIERSNIYYIGQKRFEVRDLAINSFLFSFIAGITIVGLFLGVFGYVQRYFFQDVASLYIYIILISVPFLLLNRYFLLILLAVNRVREAAALPLLHSAAKLLLIFLVLYVFEKGILGAVAVSVIVDVLIGCITGLLILKRTGISFSFNLHILKESISYGIKGYLANVFGFLIYRLDMFMVSYFMGVTSVGYYSIAVGVAEAVLYIPRAVGTILFPQISRSSPEVANRTTAIVCRLTFFVSIVACLALGLVSRPLVTILYGTTFLPSVIPLLALLPGIAILTIDSVLCADLSGRGRPEIAMYAAGAAVISNVGLNILLIPLWGITGAAIASSLCYALSALIVIVVFLRISGNGIKDIIIPLKEDLKAVYYSVYRSFR